MSSASDVSLGPLRPFKNVRGHALLVGALPPSPVVLDLGANHGDFSRQMTARFGATCSLIEANPDLARTLMSEFEVDNCAVAAERGTVHLNIAESDEGSSILELPDSSPYHRLVVGGVDVPSCTLKDAIARAGSAPIDVVKMDIEGAEVAVLSSTPESTLRAIGQITVEFHSAPGFGFDIAVEVEEVLRRMQRMGFLWLDFSRGQRENVLFLNRRTLGIGHLRALFLRTWCAGYGCAAPAVIRAREGTPPPVVGHR
jgi:FkbM family methyltransferase